jgi:hypothetical protein
MIELKNGCEVIREAPHRSIEDTTVVLAKERGPLGVVCWCVDTEGNAFWGCYGRESAEAAFSDRTGRPLEPTIQPTPMQSHRAQAVFKA